MNHNQSIIRMVEILIKKFIEYDKLGFSAQPGSAPLTFTEMMILVELSRNARMTTQEILKHFQLDRGIMSTQLNRLSSQGLICKEKDELDKRKTYYTLTDKGCACFEHIEARENEALDFVMMDLSVNEQKAILKFLSRINQLTVEKYSEL